MVTFRKRGGESVSGGIYWCFETGDRVHISPGGALPGPASATYYRLPRWILLTVLLLIGTLVVDTLPNMLKSLYAKQSEQLVFGYGVVVFSWLAVMLAIVFAGAIRDLQSMKALTAFGWRPGEAYLNGTSRKEKARKTDKQDKK
jgi:hypothetical protein